MTAQAELYVYDPHSVSARFFNSKYFRNVLVAGDKDYAKMDRHELASWVDL